MMDIKIKAIETKYNGYRFRSRLEARWAVFFDEMGIDYEYELEGFELPSGARYLPDFYLPKIQPEPVYVEIKPFFPPFKSFKKLYEFAHAGDNNLLVICGVPGKEKMYLINRVTESGYWEHEDTLLAVDDDGYQKPEGDINEMFEEFLNDYSLVYLSVMPFTKRPQTISYHPDTVNIDARHFFACQKARQSRFEFGESGPKRA